MSDDRDHGQMQPPAPQPNPDLRNLDRLAGDWDVSGGAQGRVTYRWAEGGFFLVQEVDLVQYGQPVQGLEIIGHEQAFGSEPSEEIRSRFYEFMSGMTLDYVYELDGNTLTIWAGEKGSPAYYRGTFSDGGARCAGDWVYPGGGGYQSVMTRRPPDELNGGSDGR